MKGCQTMTPSPEHPESYPRRILLAVTGLSPQVVTETLFALAVKPASEAFRFVPTEVRLITTATGEREARLNLLSARTGWFHRLCADYGLRKIAFPSENIHVLETADHKKLDDIRTAADNERAADFITGIVRDLTDDPRSAIHVSIAGGRKTMGYYLGYALSLYGRAQDRLSHVLVSEPFENNPEFFYPTPSEHRIHSRRSDKGLTFNAADAVVELAQIPFVRMREGLPERLRRGKAAFSAVVAAAARSLGEPRLVLDVARREARADGDLLDLGSTEFAVLLWLAERAKQKKPAVNWGAADAADEFITVAKRVLNSMSGDYDRIEEALAWRKKSEIKTAKYFEPHKSRITNAMQFALGPSAAARYAIARSRVPEGVVYSLPLRPDQIEIRR